MEEQFKVGDIVWINEEFNNDPNWLGEGDRVTHQGPYVVQCVNYPCITKISGIRVTLAMSRFSLYKNLYEIY